MKEEPEGRKAGWFYQSGWKRRG